MTPETFCEQFATFAEAPNGVAKLRELILQLAVQGKLGTQDVSDEPTSALLRKIDDEKSRLATLGKLKSPSQLPPVEDMNVPHTWVAVRLGSFIELISGQHLTPEEYNEAGEGHPYLTGPADFGERHPVATRWTHADRALARQDDILITVKGAGIGKINIVATDTAFISRQLMAVRPIIVDRDFVHLALRSGYDQFQRQGVGIAIPGIGRDDILHFVVALPPLTEQRRIVGKVDQLLGLCDELAARQGGEARSALVGATLDRLVSARSAAEFPAHAHRLRDHFDRLFDTPTTLPQLRQAILQLAVQGQLVPQDPNDEPASDEEIPLGKLLSEESLNGYSKAPSNAPPGIPILRISAGTSRRDFIVDETDHKWVPDAGDVEKFVLQPNDLLACRFNGNLHYVGRFSLYLGTTGQKQINPDKLIRFRVDLTRCDPRYVCFAMNARQTRDKIEAFCATTAGNIGISASNLKTVAIRVPPLAEQKRIVSKVTELLSLCDALEAKLTQAESASTQLLSAAVHYLLTQRS